MNFWIINYRYYLNARGGVGGVKNRMDEKNESASPQGIHQVYHQGEGG